MVTRCNKAGVRIYVDIVFNHMTVDREDARGTGGSTADTHKFEYPQVPYSQLDFHYPTCGVNDYSNPINVRNCELLGLHDLDQSKEHVRDKIVGLMNDVIDTGVAGFRWVVVFLARAKYISSIISESTLPNTCGRSI